MNEKTWTLIINRETDTWGAFKYNEKKDLLRTTVPVQNTESTIESLAMAFERTATGCNLVIAWENVMVSLPIVF